ncbi:hypothetical protein acsn021_12830 [Anaerocolumna cellulosilytica]|uniref:Uncharacterized protein n=1 Tax=Anaerocolumna cellulosilytica TaxID=433286 RepID=A0A6S6QSY4_9FIRM|nr:hypothetical protein [Anaerocolumna cellulosilytica]MBB5195988.1 uncharacterized protein YneF (UPF0154 family) [Anaerocolumna cellulosilytica]BCJ93714.1 hypothetical protein acsn021_12830 [Anaerocolumna cellulosilytica]
MDKKMRFLLGTVLFLAGIITGFFIAPIKQGIGNNCGNNSTNNYHNEKEENEEM